MLKQKRLKKQLGEGYRFQQYRSPEAVYTLLRSLTGRQHFVIAAALTVGVVKLEAILCWQGGSYKLGYDLLVKDTPDSPEWICYENLTDPVRYQVRNLEREMFQVLDRAVQRYRLSYTECCFPEVNGNAKK